MHAKHRGWLAVAAAGSMVVGVAVSSAHAATSGATWSDNKHHYVLVSGTGPTWVQASAAAQASSWGEPGVCNGYLATVTSQEENTFLAGQFGAGALYLKWFGGIQADSAQVAGGWAWANGEAWGYTNWNPGEPTNFYYTPQGYEDATVFWTGATWNDAPRAWSYGSAGGYVVEYDCFGVTVDVKPGSAENTVNGNDRGVIPVAILTTDTFDATTVDPMSITMNGAAVKVRGKSQTAGALEDVDGDGDMDLVVQIVDSDGVFVDGSTTVTVSALTYDGLAIKGVDSVTYVP